MATEFEITVHGTAKNLLDSIAILAEQGVNLSTVATAKVGDRFVVKFLTGNEEECRRTFMKADLHFKERRVLVMEVEDRPGAWVKAARHLLDAGVDIDASYLLGRHGEKLRFVFDVSDYEKAKKAAAEIGELGAD